MGRYALLATVSLLQGGPVHMQAPCSMRLECGPCTNLPVDPSDERTALPVQYRVDLLQYSGRLFL